MGCNASVPSRVRTKGLPEKRANNHNGPGGGMDGLIPQTKPDTASAADSPISHEPGDVHLTDSSAEGSEQQENGETLSSLKMGSMKVKDELAWKHNEGRPRSALKHSPSGAYSESGDSDHMLVERTASGRKVYRKVSFQAKGLGAPLDAEEGHNSKKFKAADDLSMKKIVDGLYERVLDDGALNPFFEGVDMEKLKNQQEALMLLVFGGNDLLETELPGISADLRAMHLHLIHRGLGFEHWEAFAKCFYNQLDAMHPPIPPEVKAKAIEYMQSTKQYFRPLEPGEWPPKNPYKGAAACPYGGSFKHSSGSRSASALATPAESPPPEPEDELVDVDLGHDGGAAGAAAAPASSNGAGQATAGEAQAAAAAAAAADGSSIPAAFNGVTSS